MTAVSAGLLMCKQRGGELHFLLVHPGGPFFRNKDQGSWSIPKGLTDENEDLLQSAVREFKEETGIIAEPPFYELGKIKQKGGKEVYAWAFLCPEKYVSWQPDKDLISNTFSLQWPPKSGKTQLFPEIDRGSWFNFQEGCSKINQAQIPFLEVARTSIPD